MKSRLKLLIVDQSSLVAPRVMNLLLNQMDDIIAGEARTDEEALLMLELTKVDVVILDIHLPIRMGLSLLRKIKTNYPLVKVIVFSNYAKSVFKEYCLKLGAEFFFEKATEFPMITSTIRHLINLKHHAVA